IKIIALASIRMHNYNFKYLVLKKVFQLAVQFTTLSLAHTIHIYRLRTPSPPQDALPTPFHRKQSRKPQVPSHDHRGGSAWPSRAAPSKRRSSSTCSTSTRKANFFRIMSLLSGIISTNRWFTDVCRWKNPTTSVLVHVLFLILICYPELILPTIFLYGFLIGLWNYRLRQRGPPHMDSKLSWAEAVNPDELDEEFDTFPMVFFHRTSQLASLVGKIRLAKIRLNNLMKPNYFIGLKLATS
ncbi:hypothetical protein MIMGU_mgv1a026669mg, partial [Erythranthe guttata]